MADPDLCERCGRCCYAKLTIDGQVVYTPYPCPYLDEDTRLCTIYEQRQEINPHCLTVEMGIRLGAFPADCPCVRGLAGYVPPRLGMTVEEIEAYSEVILEAQDEVRDAAGPALLPPDDEPL